MGKRSELKVLEAAGEGSEWVIHIQHVVNRKTGEIVDNDRIFLTDLNEGKVGLFVLGDDGSPQLDENDEPVRVYEYGDYEFVWKPDAPEWLPDDDTKWAVSRTAGRAT